MMLAMQKHDLKPVQADENSDLTAEDGTNCINGCDLGC